MTPSCSSLKSAIKAFNRAGCCVQNEFYEAQPKLVIVPENVDAMCEFIKQCGHVTYCEIKASLGIRIPQTLN